jgi:hypothetical protein
MDTVRAVFNDLYQAPIPLLSIAVGITTSTITGIAAALLPIASPSEPTITTKLYVAIGCTFTAAATRPLKYLIKKRFEEEEKSWEPLLAIDLMNQLSLYHQRRQGGERPLFPSNTPGF